MNKRRVLLIFAREVRDQLRDRRTLFMILVLPLLLYPSLGIGLFQMTLMMRQEQKTVVIVNADELPPPAFIEGEQFAAAWVESEAAARRLRVVTVDSDGEPQRSEQTPIAQAARQLIQIRREFKRLSESPDVSQEEIAARRAEWARQRNQLLGASGIDVLVVVPPAFQERFTRLLAPRSEETESLDREGPVILYNRADEEARIALSQVKAIYGRWKEAAVAALLRRAGVAPAITRIFDIEVVDVADAEEQVRSLWSKILPALLVLMTLTGAFYPAVDLAAGEKERGTMETLLICPASRLEIVIGKFLTVGLFAVCTAILNLVSMGFTGQYLVGAVLAQGGALGPGLVLPPWGALVWSGLLLIPIAALFSALCLALASFARSSKEGQYYLTPVLLVTIGLTMFAQMPTVELTPLNCVLPLVGVVLLLKEFLAGAAPYAYVLPVLLASLGYAAIAIWWAVDQFQREDILFRESERVHPVQWLRRLVRERKAKPSFGAAAFCFFLIMVLQLVAMRVAAGGLSWLPDVSPGEQLTLLLILQEIVLIALPAILLAMLLTHNIKTTFRLRLPRWQFLLAGIVLSAAIMPLSAALAQWTAWFFPKLPESVEKLMGLVNQESMPVWLLLAAFALAPALCEELAFRGFLLSGFEQKGNERLAILFSAFTFGLMHMIPQQAFNAALLGLVLGLLAVRSGSLWPGVLFHFVFNGSSVLQQRYLNEVLEDGYPWWVLLGCLMIAGGIISWLVMTPRGRTSQMSPKPAMVEEENDAGPRQPV